MMMTTTTTMMMTGTAVFTFFDMHHLKISFVLYDAE